MSANEELMQDTSNDDDYEELWIVIMQTKGRYELSKNQARIVQQAMATGERGSIMFETFAISIPYVVEFYREKRVLKQARQLPERASEAPYKPIDPVKWEEMKRNLYEKMGRKMP